MKPTYKQLEDFARWAQKKQPEALEIMRKHKIVIHDLNDPMQKLAFSLYTDLVEIENRVRNMFDDDKE